MHQIQTFDVIFWFDSRCIGMTNRKPANGDQGINNGTAQSSEIGQQVTDTLVTSQKSWHEVFSDSHNEGDNVRLIIMELSENFPENLKDISFVRAAINVLTEECFSMLKSNDDEISETLTLYNYLCAIEEAIIKSTFVIAPSPISEEMLDRMYRKEVSNDSF